MPFLPLPLTVYNISLEYLVLAMRHNTSTTTQVYLGDIERQMRLKDTTGRMVRTLLLKEGVIVT